MKIIKLDAIDSTNTFLKEMSRDSEVENFTVVVARKQYKGKGQMNAVWSSEDFKNLTFSILVEFENFNLTHQFYVSKIVSLAVRDVLATFISSKIAIKWPNDILAEQLKICGVLIENSVKKSIVESSVIGIGLNVNQTLFENLPHATSMKLLSSQTYNLDELLEKLVSSVKKYVGLINNQEFDKIDELYLKYLYKLNVPSMFRSLDSNTLFMGKIVGVTSQGQLKVERDDESISLFSLKEIAFENRL